MPAPIIATGGRIALQRMFQFLKRNREALVIGGGAVALESYLDKPEKQEELDNLIGSDTNLSDDQKDFIKKLASFVVNEEQVLWPTDREGKHIPPNYLVIDTNGGNAWFTRNYYNKKYVKSVRSRTWERSEDRQLKQLVNRAFNQSN